MTITPFPSSPVVSYGINPKKGYRILTADFGDGYSQRAADGLNGQNESMTMVWNTITYADALIIMNFLDSMQGVGAFSYQAPNDPDVKNWICVNGWDWKPQNSEYGDVTATFNRVYDLA